MTDSLTGWFIGRFTNRRSADSQQAARCIYLLFIYRSCHWLWLWLYCMLGEQLDGQVTKESFRCVMWVAIPKFVWRH